MHVTTISETESLIREALSQEFARERSNVPSPTDQWAENQVPSRQPAAVNENGGLRGSRATLKGGR
jgi:hypothetical protein